MPKKPTSTPSCSRRAFLGDVAEIRFDFARWGLATPLSGTPDVSHARFRKPPRKGIPEQGAIGVAVNVYQNMKIGDGYRFTNEDSVERVGVRVTARPATEFIPGLIYELRVLERRLIAGANGN